MFNIKHTYNEIYEGFGFPSVNLRVYEDKKNSLDRKKEYLELLGVFSILKKNKLDALKFKDGTVYYIESIESKINSEICKVNKETENYLICNMDAFFKELEMYVKVPALAIDVQIKEEMCSYLLFFFNQLEKIKKEE